MGKVLREFKVKVPVEILDTAEALITDSRDPSPEEVTAVTTMLNTVMHQFYLARTPAPEDANKTWAALCLTNSAMEQGMRQHPKCLILVKRYIAMFIGKKVLAGMENDPDYKTGRMLLYMTEGD